MENAQEAGRAGMTPPPKREPDRFVGMVLIGAASGALGLSLFFFAWIFLAGLVTGRMDGQVAMVFPVTGTLGGLIGGLVGAILALVRARHDGAGVWRRLGQIALALAWVACGVVAGFAIGVCIAGLFPFLALLFLLAVPVVPLVIATLWIYRRRRRRGG